jgi:hypothetical protein
MVALEERRERERERERELICIIECGFRLFVRFRGRNGEWQIGTEREKERERER